MGQGRLHNPDSRHPSAHWFCSSFCTHSPWGPSLEETVWTLNLLDPDLPWLPRPPCVALGRDLVTQHWPISLLAPCPVPGGHRPSREVCRCPPIQEPNTGLGSEWVPTKQMNEEMNAWTSVPFSLQDILGWEHDYLIPQQNPILKYLRKYVGCTWVKITVLFCSL